MKNILRAALVAAAFLSSPGADTDNRTPWHFAGDKEWIAVLVPADAAPPKWTIAKNTSQGTNGDKLQFTFESANGQPVAYNEPRRVVFGSAEGHAVFAFDYNNRYCFTDIAAPSGESLLSETPQTFDLVHFRDGDDETCGQGAAGVADWSGRLVLSADHDGNVTMSIYLENYSIRHEHLYTLKLPNHIAYNLNSPSYKAMVQKAQNDKERAKRAAMNEAVPEPVTVYGPSTVECYRQRKYDSYDRDFSRLRKITVCVGRPKYQRREGDTEYYTCVREALMSEYEFCAAAWCVNRYQYGKYCESGFRGVYNAMNRPRSLEPLN